MIRYADDFIVMCKTVDQAKDAYSLAKEGSGTGIETKVARNGW